MNRAKQNDAMNRSGGNSIGQSDRTRRWAVYAAVLLGAFLLGLLPTWMTARERTRERDTAQAALRTTPRPRT